MWAAYHGHLPVVDALLGKGADFEPADKVLALWSCTYDLSNVCEFPEWADAVNVGGTRWSPTGRRLYAFAGRECGGI